MAPNQIQLKHPGKKKLKSGIRKAPYEQPQKFKEMYASATLSNNQRGPPSNQRTMSNNNGYQQVKLRQDLSMKSN